MTQEKKNVTTGLMYKSLFIRLKCLIVSPHKEWIKIHQEDKSVNEVLTEFALPLIGMCAIATFLNIVFNRLEVNFELALKHAVVSFSALFGGLYLSWFIFRFLLSKFEIAGNSNFAFRVVAYSSGLFYLINIVTNLLPELFFLQLASVYSLYIIWFSIHESTDARQEKRVTITLIVAVLIYFIPFFVKNFLLKLIAF